MADPRALARIHVFSLRTPSGGMRPSFLIDGRRYARPEDVRAAIDEACDALEDRGLIAEFETRPAGPELVAPELPTWEEYRKSLGGS